MLGGDFFKPVYLGSVISCQWLQPRDILVKRICLIYFLNNAFFEQKSNQNQRRLKKKTQTVTVISGPGFSLAVWIPPSFPVLLPLCSVPDQNIKQRRCPAVRWKHWLSRQVELPAPAAAPLSWLRTVQREEGADPLAYSIPKAGGAGRVQGKEEVGKSVSVCRWESAS